MPRLSRLLMELRRAPPRSEIEDALARAPLRDEDGTVHIDEDVYASIPTREARIALLERARDQAKTAVVLHAHVEDDGTHFGRLAVDAPRRLLRRAGITRAPDPGDRWAGGRFEHRFFDEEAIRGEIAEAGLFVERVRGRQYVLAPGRSPEDPADPFAAELARVLSVVWGVEKRRLREPPATVVRSMRARGARREARGPIGRARLRRAIGWVDAFMPGGANCYRRTLLELALDRGAARETLVFGLRVGSTGHVAFKHREDRAFDVDYELGPDEPA